MNIPGEQQEPGADASAGAPDRASLNTRGPVHPYWFVFVIRASGMPPWMFGVLCGSTLAAVFLWLYGFFGASAERGNITDLGTALFFASVNAYALSAGAYVIRRTQTAFDQLLPLLDLSPAKAADFRTRLAGGGKLELLLIALGAVTCGLLHNQILGSPATTIYAQDAFNPFAFGTFFGTTLTWFVIMHVASAFVSNARMFARLGRRHTRIDLLNPHELVPFGTVAWLPALGLVGTQMVYPLLSLAGELNLTVMLPGFVFTSVALFFLFLHPTWGLHTRLVSAKQAALEEVNASIRDWQAADAGRDDKFSRISTLQPLLSHRDYLQSVPEWPFSLSTVGRWTLYLIIPPVTWVLAALIEIVVDGMV